MPVGTIRSWSQGDMIKAHNPFPPFSSGWIPLKTSTKFNGLGNDCDGYAKDILLHKLPINGEKFLDHMIDEFGESIGKSKFFNADNFKKYEGYHNAGRYAFRNEFSKLFMQNDMDLDEAICEAMVKENEDIGGDKDNDKLNKEEKKGIRDRVKFDFKNSERVLTEEKARTLLEVVKRTKTQVEEGLDFKDPAKKLIYEDFKKQADNLIGPYELISIKRKKKFEAVDLIETHFQDNWGVRESCKDYIQKNFDEYVRMYADQISKDSLEEQLRLYGVTMNMEPDEFYSKIYKKASKQNWDFLENFVGKEITIIGNGIHKTSRRVKVFKKKVMAVEDNEVTHYDIYFSDRTITGGRDLIRALNNKEIILSPEYNEMASGFKDLIYLRFMKRYNKSVEGEWMLEHLPAIHNLENIIVDLPKGHFLTNDKLKLITNKNYKGGSNGAYAYYSSGEERINLSADLIDRSTTWGVLSNPTEFKSVMLHEIGHSVSQKLGRSKYYDYKKFVVEAGWSYQSKELRARMTATGDEKDIPRSGSNASVSLITKYASKAPEEAFAEYYSFYNLNREHFDKFFETGDTKHLKTTGKKIAKSVSSEQTISQMLPRRVNTASIIAWDHYKEVEPKISDRGQEQKITLGSPWAMSLSHEEKRKYEATVVKQRKDYSINSMPPIVVVKNGMERHCIDGGVRIEVAKMNKQLVPAIEISKELYTKLRERGLSDHEISNCIYTKNQNNYIPKQIAPEVEVRGLIYRDELVPFDQIIENYGVIKTMKEVCESKELQKALEGMLL